MTETIFLAEEDQKKEKFSMWPERLSFGEQVKSRRNLFMRIHRLFLYYVTWACKLAFETKKVPIFFKKKKFLSF